jgi:hypothetical protein
MNLTLEEAKERVSIGALWLEFGFEMGNGKSSRCPFHPDATPSFSTLTVGAAGSASPDAVRET